jgi:tetraacyldisaccharide 4'-kinase
MALPWLEAPDAEAERARVGVLGGLLLAPLTPVSWVYGGVARLHRAAYAGGWLPTRRLPCRVISVGSLVVGGSGKTPLAAWIASGLHARGYRVVLATRGYRRSGRDPVHALSDGRRLRGDPVGSGDEPLVLAAHSAGVPVLVGRDRGVVGLRAVAAFGADVLVLDDGFQHHRLHRDLDVVTFDGRFGLGNGLVLPRGPLREPASALARAHAVAVIDGPLAAADERAVTRLAASPHRIVARRRATTLRSIRGGPGEPATALAGLRVGLLAGLGQPDAFQRTLEEHGATVVARRVFRDHHRYRPRDVRDLHREAGIWVTTEKDAGKILPGWTRADLRVLRMTLQIEDGEAVLDWLKSRLEPGAPA